MTDFSLAAMVSVPALPVRLSSLSKVPWPLAFTVLAFSTPAVMWLSSTFSATEASSAKSLVPVSLVPLKGSAPAALAIFSL